MAGALALIGGCASLQPGGPEPHDPYEAFNRDMFAFNKALDEAILAPIAHGYIAVVPAPAREAVFNFFDNLGYLTTVANQLLQGKFERGLEDAGRFVFNSTFGLGGLIDFASGIEMPRHEEDFDQTLAVWGVPSGAYMELPFLGPKTERGIVAIPVDMVTDLGFWIGGSTAANLAMNAVDVVDTRARLDSAIKLRDRTALDPYVFQREAYLQRRRSLIYDGNPPLDDGPTSPR